ncbi:MAG: SDR family oxidoreductase [Chloroflexi bacterium]|nr:SDR family oxidoreductase [Chloroflexota bacterium]
METGEPRVDRLIEADGGQAVFVLGDIAEKSTNEAMVAIALERYGGLDVLFLNAGTGVRKRIHEMSDEEWDHVVGINLGGVYHGVRAAIPHFLEVGRGNIVATASTFGLMASPRYPAYSATKAAIVNLTRALAIDYGPDIRVNCVCPGPTDTPRIREFPPRARMLTETQKSGATVHALHRLARPEEIAYAVLFLASDESSFVTGHALVVDGGQTITASSASV